MDTKSTVCTTCHHEHKNEDGTCSCGCAKSTTEKIDTTDAE